MRGPHEGSWGLHERAARDSLPRRLTSTTGVEDDWAVWCHSRPPTLGWVDPARSTTLGWVDPARHVSSTGGPPRMTGVPREDDCAREAQMTGVPRGSWEGGVR